ncbi:uncharacterized protein LOC110737391 isoform X1 [Chenopodium quinoa]|uniref:uncharacterized protein LOC110737391 isoform X1 n=1 Tax=Chenopodium quinoa TaxID=63459 RepID=UPI000B792231|nr:uncharacterized protein LOC110737391 isoform X1 [Chenopodium quinoa]
MTYRSMRAREILAATAKSNATEVVSQPTKKQATKSPQTEVLKDDKWGPFSPPNTTTKSDQQPPNSLGSVWKNHPGSTSSSVKEATTSGYHNKYPAKVPPNIPPNIPQSSRPNSSLKSLSTSHKPPEQAMRRGIEALETGAVKTSATAPQNNQDRQNSRKESEKIPIQSKSLRPKALPDWPVDIDFDYKEEVLTIDAKGNTTLVSGIILPIDVWSNNGVQYYVEFNDLCQPIRKSGHILVKFISMIAKMESHCPVGEKDWKAIDKHFKGKIIKDIRDRFVIPPGVEYDNQALKRSNKCWRQFKYSLKLIHYKPLEKKLDDMCNNVPHGITSSNWVKLVKYWDLDYGKTMSECGKKARPSLNQIHTSGSKSFANQQADYEDEHGQRMSLLALWIKTHAGKDGKFLPDTVTQDFVDDVKAKVEELRMVHPKMSEQELEDEAFQQTMYGNEIPDRPVGYGQGVKKGDIFGVHGVLRKEGYGKVQKRTIVMDSVKEEVNALHKKNGTLSQENEKLKDEVRHNNLLLKALVGQFSQIVGAVRQGNASPGLLNKGSEFLGKAKHQIGKGNVGATRE